VEWEYEPDKTPKRKHSWEKNAAGFISIGTTVIGKCPKGISIDTAKELLNSGIPWSPRRWEKSHPQRIYAIHHGVLYRAMPTIPGKSYHGFPEHPRSFSELPKALREKIFEHAKQLGCLEQVRKWVNQ